MDLLDRLLGHDAWTTRHLLLLCRDLTDEQLDREFDIAHRTVRATFAHIINNVEAWSDCMAGHDDIWNDEDIDFPDKWRFLSEALCDLVVGFIQIHPYLNGNGHISRVMVLSMTCRYNIIIHRWVLDQRLDPPGEKYDQCVGMYIEGNLTQLRTYILTLLRENSTTR